MPSSQQGAPAPLGRSGASRGPRIAAWIGIVVHALLGVFPYSATGLLAPLWAVATVGAVWLALLVAAIRLRRSRPWLAAATPLVSVAFWFAFLFVGDVALGWTA